MVAQVSKPADLSGLGSRERDCRSEAKARPEGPNERERVSQSRVSKPADRTNAGYRKTGFVVPFDFCSAAFFESPKTVIV
jgi:hypothetical protein